MNINLTPIIEALIGLLAAFITYRLIPYIKAKTTNEQQIYITALIKSGVFAAEQLYQADGMGAKKMEFVRQYLAGKGYDINTSEIEAVVSEYINNSPFNPRKQIGEIKEDNKNKIDTPA